MDFIQQNVIDPVSGFLWTYVLVYVLLGVGVYFGIRTRFVQVRLFPRMLRQILSSREGSAGGISSSSNARRAPAAIAPSGRGAKSGRGGSGSSCRPCWRTASRSTG